jgi:integrase/recombinase XerD
MTTTDNSCYHNTLLPLARTEIVRAEPMERLVAGWLVGFESLNTRRAYGRDAAAWLVFCSSHDVEPLVARRPHVDAWARTLSESGASPATVARKLAAVSSWYSWLLAEDEIAATPLTHVRRPRVSDESSTLGPDRDEARALLAAAHDLGPRYEALVALLLLNGLRVSEVLNADADDLDTERGHRVLRITRKGGRRAMVPLAPRTSVALDTHLGERTMGPLFVGAQRGHDETARLTSAGAAYMVDRTAKRAGITKHLSPHSLRHGFVTLSLEAGVALTDVQDAAGHADPRTTRRYESRPRVWCAG